MKAFLLKTKDFFTARKLWVVLCVLVFLKSIFEKSGYIATPGSGKSFAFFMFSASLSLAFYAFYKRLSVGCLKQTIAFTGIILFIFYLCFSQNIAYALETNDYYSLFFIILAAVTALSKKTLALSLPLSLAAVFVSPEMAAAGLPVILAEGVMHLLNLPGKNDEKKETASKKKVKAKKTTRKKKKTKPVINYKFITDFVAKIHPAITVVFSVVIYIISFVVYRSRNPYDPMFSSPDTMRNDYTRLLYYIPVVLLVTIMWICFIKAEKKAAFLFAANVVCALLSAALIFVIPVSGITPDGFVCVILFDSLILHTLMFEYYPDISERFKYLWDRYCYIVIIYLVAVAGITIKIAG